jgi:hypothetical protein
MNRHLPFQFFQPMEPHSHGRCIFGSNFGNKNGELATVGGNIIVS